MKYYNHFEDLKLHHNTVITLGKFDGLHEGHRNLIETMMKVKEKKGLRALIFTFSVPPKSHITGQPMPVITTNEEKRALFEEIGVDYFIECPFSDELMRMSPREFVSFLVNELQVKCFVVGEDFCFGYQRAGNIETLEALSKEFGYDLFVKSKIQHKGRDISSTYIREELVAGNMKTAEKLLGYPYFIENKIVHGNHIGRKMGIPTVNMEIDPQKVIPPKGVYVSRITILDDGSTYMGISNIGNKPTIGDDYPTGVESFLFDFDGDLYGKVLRVSLLYYVREERKFENLDALKAQIDKDISFAREYYGNVTKVC